MCFRISSVAINRLALDAAADLVLRALILTVPTPLASRTTLTHHQVNSYQRASKVWRMKGAGGHCNGNGKHGFFPELNSKVNANELFMALLNKNTSKEFSQVCPA